MGERRSRPPLPLLVHFGSEVSNRARFPLAKAKQSPRPAFGDQRGPPNQLQPKICSRHRAGTSVPPGRSSPATGGAGCCVSSRAATRWETTTATSRAWEACAASCLPHRRPPRDQLRVSRMSKAVLCDAGACWLRHSRREPRTYDGSSRARRCFVQGQGPLGRAKPVMALAYGSTLVANGARMCA
jgi:hypothetical protein